MSRGVNRVIIVGNLGKDPEIRYTPSGLAVAKFSLATTENRKSGDQWEEVTEWHNVTLFGKSAEAAQNYLAKGRQVYIEGRIHYDQWEKDGVKHYTTQIIGDKMLLLGTRPDGGDDSAQRSSKASPPPSRMTPEPDYPPDEPEGDLPF